VRVVALSSTAGSTTWQSRRLCLLRGRCGLEVVDVSSPTNCVRVGGYDTGWQAMAWPCLALCVPGEWQRGLQIFDVSNPARPVRVGGSGFFTSGYAVNLAVSANTPIW